mgnify:CR=1 FL=1
MNAINAITCIEALKIRSSTRFEPATSRNRCVGGSNQLNYEVTDVRVWSLVGSNEPREGWMRSYIWKVIYESYIWTLIFEFSLQSTLLPILLTLGFCYSAILERNSNQKSQDNPVYPTVSWRKLSKTIQRQPQLKVNPLISSIASKRSSFEISVRLFGKSQVFLQITADGTVNGTVDCTSKYGEKHFLSCQFIYRYLVLLDGLVLCKVFLLKFTDGNHSRTIE